MVSMDTYRFAVGSAVGNRSSVWRIWTEKDGSTYIGDRQVAGRVHVSLHATGRWHLRLRDSQGNVVHDKRWQRPPPFKGLTKAFMIIIPSTEVVQRTAPIKKPDRVAWWPAPLLNHYRSFAVLILPPGGTFGNLSTDPRGPQVPAVLPLPNGESVHLLTRELPMEEPFSGNLERYKAFVNRASQEVAKHPDWQGPGEMHSHIFGKDDDTDAYWFIDVAPM
jgi:hypothetical protein